MCGRNRASGWKHAKLSGHENENRAKALLDGNSEYAKSFLQRLGKTGSIIDTSVGGLYETNVLSVTGKKTKSKTDLKVFLNNDETINISIKKSLVGQIYFVKASMFIEVYEKQFNEKIPEAVIRAIKLFWSEAEDAVKIIEKYADKIDKQSYERQIRHKSVNAVTLRNYDEMLFYNLLNWFAENSFKIAKLAFSMGGVADSQEWSEYIWYKNLLKENNTDEILKIQDICVMAQRFAKQETYYTDRNGGSTIRLPFGFVEWHQGKLQFHGDYNKIKFLMNNL